MRPDWVLHPGQYLLCWRYTTGFKDGLFRTGSFPSHPSSPAYHINTIIPKFPDMSPSHCPLQSYTHVHLCTTPRFIHHFHSSPRPQVYRNVNSEDQRYLPYSLLLLADSARLACTSFSSSHCRSRAMVKIPQICRSRGLLGRRRHNR